MTFIYIVMFSNCGRGQTDVCRYRRITYTHGTSRTIPHTISMAISITVINSCVFLPPCRCCYRSRTRASATSSTCPSSGRAAGTTRWASPGTTSPGRTARPPALEVRGPWSPVCRRPPHHHTVYGHALRGLPLLLTYMCMHTYTHTH